MRRPWESAVEIPLRSPLKLADLGLLAHPGSGPLADVRRQALDRLRAQHPQPNPFKFIIYSGWPRADLSPVE